MLSLLCWYIYYRIQFRSFSHFQEDDTFSGKLKSHWLNRVATDRLYLTCKYIKLICPLPFFICSLFVASLDFHHLQKFTQVNDATEPFGILGETMNKEETKRVRLEWHVSLLKMFFQKTREGTDSLPASILRLSFIESNHANVKAISKSKYKNRTVVIVIVIIWQGSIHTHWFIHVYSPFL